MGSTRNISLGSQGGIRAACFVMLLIVTLLLSGCGATTSQPETPAPTDTPAATDDVTPEEIPDEDVALCAFDEDAMVGSAEAAIDASHAAQGYVGARATSTTRLKLQVKCGDAAYNYDLDPDGSPSFVPLTFGSGTYRIRIMENTSGNRYAELFAATVEVTLADELQPYLRPTYYCSYDEDSDVVAKARELRKDASDEGAFIDAVYDYVTTHVSYDDAKAKRLSTEKGYVPDPDDTLEEGSGVCFDYASLTAAMLRSQGIPTKIVTGYLGKQQLYHAWNEIYVEGSWHVTAFSASGNDWNRVDTTLAASGSGPGSSYTTRYEF